MLAELEVEIEVETKGGVECTVNTARENIGTSGTHFHVITREAGTVVDVLGGQLELKRKGEAVGTNIIQDYKVLVPRDKSLTVISPRPLYMQVGLSAVMPGTGKIYAQRDIKMSLATKALSISALIGFAVCSAKRGDASEASINAHNDYKTEIKPDKIEEFYNRHQDNVDKANKYRKLQIGFAALYGVLSVYETVSTIRGGLADRKMIKEIRGLEKELRSSQIGLEIRDDVILSKARWNFE